MKLTKKNLAIGGILASIVLLFINNTESGEALAENIRTRYELATRRARNRLRVFGIFEAIMLIAALISFRAGMWEQGCWLVFFLLLPFLASMFFIRAAFPSSEGVIKGIAIPIFMLLDVLLVAILALNPGEVTYATLALSYLMIIKLGSDLGMITGIFTNRPYILTFWSAILVLILGLGLRLSAYDVEIVNHLNSRKRDNLKGTIQMVTVTHDINPYRLTENEITEIVQEGYDGGRAKLNRFIGWKTVDTTITAGTTLAVCKWVQPVISMSGVTNVVVITAGPNGDFNLAGSDSKELAGQMFLVPLGYTSEGGDYQQQKQQEQKNRLAPVNIYVKSVNGDTLIFNNPDKMEVRVDRPGCGFYYVLPYESAAMRIAAGGETGMITFSCPQGVKVNGPILKQKKLLFDLIAYKN